MEYGKNALNLLNKLNEDNIKSYTGKITFKLGKTSVDIDTTDIVGQSIQSWLKQYMLDNNIKFMEMSNTQEFPDFILNENNMKADLLEVKAFNYEASPAFDIANFESYLSSLLIKPYRIFSDYIIFGYTMNNTKIRIEQIWLKKIWEISSSSCTYPLRVQDKRGMIYNIRPCKWYSNKKLSHPPFESKEEFIGALYKTMKQYSHTSSQADNWLKKFKKSYYNYFKEDFKI